MSQSVALYDALDHMEAAQSSLPRTLPLQRAHDLITEALGIVGDAIEQLILKEAGDDTDEDLSDWDALVPPSTEDIYGLYGDALVDDGSYTLTLDEWRAQ